VSSLFEPVEFDRSALVCAYVASMPSDRKHRAVTWLLHHLRIPAPIASRMLSWGLGGKVTAVPYTAQQIVEAEADDAARSATG
jgi:hypothetical protein